MKWCGPRKLLLFQLIIFIATGFLKITENLKIKIEHIDPEWKPRKLQPIKKDYNMEQE